MSINEVSRFSSTRNQYFAAFAVNLITLSHGCAIGWLSPFLPYLRSQASHLTSGPVSSEDVSWIGSLLCIGGFFGTIIFGKISQKFGKKVALLLLVVPHLTFWILVIASTHIYHLYVARLFAGLTGGGTIRTVSLFITEISENKIRGKLGSYLILFLSSGTLIIFIAGTYLSFFIVPLVIIVFPVVFFITVLFLPDTPPSLISRNKPEEALKSMRFYRTYGEDMQSSESLREEYELLKTTLEKKDYEKLELSDFLTKPAKKGLIIGMFLMTLNQFSGTMALMTYTADIFKESGSNLEPNESSVIVAIIQLIGVYISTICVEKFGRKFLMTVSCLGTALFFFILAAYCFLRKKTDVDLTGYEWVPVLSLSLVIFIASLGIISLPFVIMTELLPNKIRNTACTICMSGITLLAFIVLKIFPLMLQKFGLGGCLMFFSLICFLGAFVTIAFIPETKGKSLIAPIEESSEMLKPKEKKIQII